LSRWVQLFTNLCFGGCLSYASQEPSPWSLQI